MGTAPTGNSRSDERRWPAITLTKVLDSREDLLVEYAAAKGVSIDTLREQFKAKRGQTHLCNFADSLVLDQTEDPYFSYVEWLRGVAIKLQIGGIGRLGQRLAPFGPNKTVGRIEGTANLAPYVYASAMREGRDP